MADIGWITGHSYIVYGRSLSAATSVLYEGVRNSPTPLAPGVSPNASASTSSTLPPPPFECSAKPAPDEPRKYNYSFKHMTTVGEPIEPEVWRWLLQVVGKRQSRYRGHLVANRNRRFLCTTKPALDRMKLAAPPRRARNFSRHLG